MVKYTIQKSRIKNTNERLEDIKDINTHNIASNVAIQILLSEESGTSHNED